MTSWMVDRLGHSPLANPTDSRRPLRASAPAASSASDPPTGS